MYIEYIDIMLQYYMIYVHVNVFMHCTKPQVI